ncbi:MAG: glycosyltransferase family 4 protein [Planctomycetaceae bacterium]|nr:glycosyltransferase family 4 protein [Planctomycetaceae bacterium]
MTRPLRILVAQNVPHHRCGGMSRMLGFLHDRVALDGHEVEFFTADQMPARWNGRFARFSFPWLLRRHIIAAARAGRPYDVVNVHEPHAGMLAFGQRAMGDPYLVVTSHGLEERGWQVALADAELGRMPLSRKARFLHPATVLSQARLGLRHADHVFCLNDDDRSYLMREYGYTPERVTRLFPAADPAYAVVFPRRDYSLEDRILVFGTWLPRKGAADIVAAFESLAATRPRLKLTLMGMGFPAESVAAWFPESLRTRLEFVPPSGEAELAERMLSAAVYWIPSLFEGTPQTLIETMATGMPAVATATCGMKDVVRDSENGLLIPLRVPAALASATDRLLSDRKLRERLGRQAHADAAEHYTWDRVAEPVRAVYQRIAEERILA